MMKEHCDHCDAVIAEPEYGNRRSITIGSGFNVNVHLTLSLDGAPQRFCDRCLDLTAMAFAERGRVPFGCA